jgi:UDP-N-acetylglucosamine acyltransferase
VAKRIHPTALVDSGAELGDDVEVGPFVTVGEHVRIGRGTVVEAHASLAGWTTIGENCHVFQGACIGMPPQDVKYEPCRSYVRVGNSTQIREYVTIHPGSGPEEVTHVGDNCLLMAYSHVAHNCVLEDHVILANVANLAGHIVVEAWAILGGVTGVHQFTRIGYGAFVGGCSAVRQDLLPFVRAAGLPCRPIGINAVGLRRRGFSTDRIRTLERAYRIVFHRGLTVAEAGQRLVEEFPDSEDVGRIAEFISQAKRGLARPRGHEGA